jgi:delta 1-pyrroline-5-carboxylate dehydrogenase
VKGQRRNTLARLCSVFKSGAKADEIASSLKDLNLTKDIVQSKIEELKIVISEKELSVAPIIAEQRERQDFLEYTAEYADEDPNDDSDVGEL